MHQQPQGPTTIFKIRQILNLLFIIIGIIGAGVNAYGQWGAHDERIKMMGIVIVIIAMAIKMAECVLRYMK